jgi:hypothetical protein
VRLHAPVLPAKADAAHKQKRVIVSIYNVMVGGQVQQRFRCVVIR